MRKSVLIVLLIVCAVATPLTADDGDSHLVSLGINPLGWIWGSYRIDVGVPLGGLLEVGGQLNYFSFKQFVGLFPWAEPEDQELPSLLSAGPVLRVFPAQNAQGFFIGARMMFFRFAIPETNVSLNDMTAGIDVGWRFKWDLRGPVGLFFQTHLGVQRWLFTGDLDFWPFPILPTAGMHFGVHF